VAVLLLSSIRDVTGSLAAHDRAYLVFNIVFLMFSVFAWPLLTIGRLTELHLNRLWILPLLVPFAVATLATSKGWPLVFRAALGVSFLIQLPLVIFSPPTAHATTEIESSNGPSS
jgi:hypothetical protein